MGRSLHAPQASLTYSELDTSRALKKLGPWLLGAAVAAAIGFWAHRLGRLPTDVVTRALWFPLLTLWFGLGAIFVRRHLRLAAALQGSHAYRHAGLAFALSLWAAMSYWGAFVRGAADPPRALRSEAAIFFAVAEAFLMLPAYLMIGVLWLRGVRRGLGGPPVPQDRDESDRSGAP